MRHGHADAVRAVLDGARRRLVESGFRDRALLLDSLLGDAPVDLPDAGVDAGADAGADAGTRPEHLPVLRHLERAIALAGLSPAAELAPALARCAPDLPWTRTASYLRSPPNPQFLDQYAHAPLAGRAEGGPADAVVGLLLLAPDTRYPLHHHPADELYLPLTQARWAHDRGQEPEPEPAGVLLHHRPWQPHAMTTGDEPLLAVYVWTGDVTTASTFC